jgi:hypothetical protein
MPDDPVLDIFLNALGSCPTFLFWLAAGMVAVATWRKHANVSALVLMAVLWQLLLHGVQLLVYTLLPRTFSELELDGQEISWLYRGVNFMFSIGYVIGYAMLIAAVFKWRGAAVPPPGPTTEIQM